MSAGVQKLKSRIKSAKNIAQITKAMEMVSAAKMRKAQERALLSKPYAEAISQMLGMVGARMRGDVSAHPLLQVQGKPENALVILMTSNKGLAGSFHAGLFRKLSSLEKQLFEKDLGVSYVAYGKKGRDFLRYTKRNIAAVFDNLGDHPTTRELRPMVQFLTNEFTSGRVAEVYLVYAEFVSTLVQKPTAQKLLPFAMQAHSQDLEEKENEILTQVPIFEPNKEQLLNMLLPFAVEFLVYKAVVQNLASEHSARMMAMKNAHDNAKEIGADLLLAYNQIRQATITAQINEIAGATMASYS
ncbi:MAG: ATP synthase gamma chain [Patescibacteria group bacterium]|nr:MAG: ATP synthase gamma chain [Patescibacteria group bacterium]